MRRMVANIFWLGTKELRAFSHDFVLVALVVWAFSFSIVSIARSSLQELHDASIGIADEDQSALSRRISQAFLPPYFKTPRPIATHDIEGLMNTGALTFVIDIPPNFQRDLVGGRQPRLQVYVDATAMMQASAPVISSRSSLPNSTTFCHDPRSCRARRSISTSASPSIQMLRPPGSPA
jgi:ABC-2 type transport system permease protein